jgi:hypothetical protein
MSYSKEVVEQSKKDRQAFRDKLQRDWTPCPFCTEPLIVQGSPCGGAGHCWIECTCGAYSPLCKTWDEALQRWPTEMKHWDDKDPDPGAMETLLTGLSPKPSV